MDAPTSPKGNNNVDKFGNPNKLHYIIIANMIPALALSIPHGVLSSNVAPALGLIPAGFAAILAFYRSGLYCMGRKPDEPNYQILLSDDREERRKHVFRSEGILFAIADFLFFAALIITIAFASITNPTKCHYSNYKWNNTQYHNSWCDGPTLPMLAAYATFPLIANA
jgi:hypothetical protein